MIEESEVERLRRLLRAAVDAWEDAKYTYENAYWRGKPWNVQAREAVGPRILEK
mgnify:CR=1 FL=1